MSDSYYPTTIDLSGGIVQTIRTSRNNPKVTFDKTGITATDAAGNVLFKADAINGTLTATGLTVAASNITGQIDGTTQITPNSITTGDIAANAITAAKISVTQLSAISANMGSITAGTITGATIQTASGAVAKVKMDSSGIFTTDSSGATKLVQLNSTVGLSLPISTSINELGTSPALDWTSGGTSLASIYATTQGVANYSAIYALVSNGIGLTRGALILDSTGSSIFAQTNAPNGIFNLVAGSVTLTFPGGSAFSNTVRIGGAAFVATGSVVFGQVSGGQVALPFSRYVAGTQPAQYDIQCQSLAGLPAAGVTSTFSWISFGQ